MARPSKTEKTVELNKPTKKEIELADRVNQLEAMIKQLIESNSIKTMDAPKVSTNSVPEIEEDIPFKKYIKVMSLTNHNLILSTGGNGKGKIYDFTEFGQVKNILYDDLADIVHNNQRFAKNGAFVIMNDKVVKLHGLTQDYERFLNKDKIENILYLDSSEIDFLLRNTTKKILETVFSIVRDKMLDGERVDLNKVQIISDIYGQDINQIIRNIKNSKG